MTMQTVGGVLTLNSMPIENMSPASDLGTILIDASAEKAAFIFTVPKTGNIAKLGFRLGTVTVSDTLKVGLQTLTTSANPSGTQYGGSTPGTVSGLSSDTGYTVALSVAASAVRGDRVAMVIEFNSYVAGNLRVRTINAAGFGQGWPNSKAFVASWAQHNGIPIMWAIYDDGTVAPIHNVFPFSGFASTAFNSGSTPDEYGLKFKLPFQARLYGITSFVTLPSGGNVDFVLYDSDGSTTLSLVNCTGDNMVMAQRRNHIEFTNASILLPDTYYRVTVRPNTTTSSVTIDTYTVHTTSVMDMLDGGQGIHATTRVNGGAWTDAPTQRVNLALLLDQVDVSTAGGMVVHPGMGGGMRG